MTGRDKLEINYYLNKIERAKKDIINRTKRQNIWFESNYKYEIANSFKVRWLYAKLDSIIAKL